MFPWCTLIGGEDEEPIGGEPVGLFVWGRVKCRTGDVKRDNRASHLQQQTLMGPYPPSPNHQCHSSQHHPRQPSPFSFACPPHECSDPRFYPRPAIVSLFFRDRWIPLTIIECRQTREESGIR